MPEALAFKGSSEEREILIRDRDRSGPRPFG